MLNSDEHEILNAHKYKNIGRYKVQKESSLAKKCKKSGQDAKRAQINEKAGTAM